MRSLTQRCMCWRALGEQAGAGASGAWKGPLIRAKAKATALAFTGVWAAVRPSAKLVSSAPMNVYATKIPSMDYSESKEKRVCILPSKARRILGLGSCQALETSVQGKIWKNFCTCLLVMSIGTDSRVPGLSARLPKLRPAQLSPLKSSSPPSWTSRPAPPGLRDRLPALMPQPPHHHPQEESPAASAPPP